MTPEQKILAEAQKLIEAKGLAKGSYSYESGAVCAYGAMSMVVGGNTEFPSLPTEQQELINQAARLLLREIDGPPRWDTFSTVTRFNDDKNTTAEDMILAMKRAANHDA